jgi:hypothetical protein
MAVIRSGATTDELTVDPTSKAARVTLYDSAGNALVKSSATYAVTAKAISTGSLASASKVLASLWHTSSSTKTVRLRGVKLFFDSVSANTTLTYEILYFGSNTLPSGGSAVVPTSLDPADAAAEASFQTLPSTAGANETAVAIAVWKNIAGVIAASTSELYRDGVWIWREQDLNDLQIKVPKLRAGSQEGWNFKVTDNTTSTIVNTFAFYFTEE